MWLSVDPLAEKYPGFNPFNYCINNPLRLIDPDGKDIIPKGSSKNVERINALINIISDNSAIGKYLIDALKSKDAKNVNISLSSELFASKNKYGETSILLSDGGDFVKPAKDGIKASNYEGSDVQVDNNSPNVLSTMVEELVHAFQNYDAGYSWAKKTAEERKSGVKYQNESVEKQAKNARDEILKEIDENQKKKNEDK